MPRLEQTVVILLSLVVTTSAWAQAPSAGASSTSSPIAAPQGQEGSAGSDDDALLARTAKLYYSTRTTGLTGFDCAVHPDWRPLFESSVKHSTVSENDPNVLMLKTVAITLHARLNGKSIVDWKPPSDSAAPAGGTFILEQMHKAVDQTLKGFIQFWRPFVDGSAVPPNSKGLEITHAATGTTLHSTQLDANFTEVFSDTLVLQQFSVVTAGNSFNFQPSYESTDRGLLISRFVVDIRPENAPADKSQKMNVEIYYLNIDGYPIPSKLNVEVVGKAVFNFALDDCRVNPAS